MAPEAITSQNSLLLENKTTSEESSQRKAITAATAPRLQKLSALSPDTTGQAIVDILEADGGVIITELYSKKLMETVKTDLAPHFAADKLDNSGFFPKTTQRATGLFAKSDAFVEMALNELWLSVADQTLTSKYSYWAGQEQHHAVSKPQISSTVGFRVNPGGKQQGLHRDDTDYHTSNQDYPMMLGCVTALTKTTKENGATIVIPGSHNWGQDRCPYDHESIPAELEPGDSLIFFGNTYHAGGGNITTDQARETVGIFMCKGFYRQAENQYLMVPPEEARRLPTKAKRLLGYGISPPSVGFMDYQDPMKVLYNIVDEETVDM